MILINYLAKPSFIAFKLMAININPNRISTPLNAGSKAAERRRQQPQTEHDKVVVPRRASENYIPEPESLATLIRSAVAALRKGITWDRGTILNVVV